MAFLDLRKFSVIIYFFYEIKSKKHEFNYSFIKATNPLENNTITVC